MDRTPLSPNPAGPLAGAWAAFEGALARHPFLLPLAIYLLFTAATSWVQGAEPPLSIDHIAYFKLAEEIRADYPAGDYWHTFNAVRGYGVLLAYLGTYTGSHVASLKLILAILTVLYLGAAQVFMGLTRATRGEAMVFSMLSALFVTFGASIWGMTDFAASLNRTIIIPPVMLLAWYFFREIDSPRRYVVFPCFILLSLLHLSALHVFLVWGVFEAIDFAVRRRFRLDRQVAWFIASIAAAMVMQGAIESLSAGTTGYIRYTLNMTVPKLAAMLPQRPEPAPTPAAIAASEEIRKAAAEAKAIEAARAAQPPKQAAAGAKPAKRAEAGKAGPTKDRPAGESSAGESKIIEQAGALPRLSTQEAWRIELLAFPWRNFPPSLATIATIASSYGVIFFLAAWGCWRALRSGTRSPVDVAMLLFAIAAFIAAYGLQFTLWMLRSRVAVLPINFEEIRAINLVMIPSVYFAYRLFELAPPLRGVTPAAFRVALVAAFALQPVTLVRALPAPAREALLQQAVEQGVVKSSDAPRMLYARQFLGLAGDGRRFYYASRPALLWLEKHAGPDDRVLTNLNEFHMSRVKAIGPFLGIVNYDSWDVRRTRWADILEEIDDALASKDLGRVLELARETHATYAVVDWPVPGAVYADDNYSVVRVPPTDKGTGP